MKNSKEIKDGIQDLLEVVEKELAKDQPDLDFVDEIQEKIDKEEAKLKKVLYVEEKQAKRAEKKADHPAPADLSVSRKGENKEAATFRFTKAIRELKKEGRLTGIEREIVEDGEKELKGTGVSYEGNLHIPARFMQYGPDHMQKDYRRKAGEFTITTEGGDIVETDFRGYIPLLKVNPAVLQAGATPLRNLSGDVQIPRFTAGSTVAWEGEVDANAKSTATTDNIKLQPKRFGLYHVVSNQSLLQSSFDLEQAMRNEIGQAMAVEIDRVAIEGATGSGEPEGILNLSGIGDVDENTDGGIGHDEAVDLIVEVLKDNVGLDGSASFMGSALVLGHLSKQRTDSGSGLFVMKNAGTDMPAMRGEVIGYPFYMNNNVPDDLTTDSHSALIFGKFSDQLIGFWGSGASFLVDPYSEGINAATRLVINQWMDIVYRHPESFAAAQDIVV